MQGDQRRRFCESCQLHVHNLSALTKREIKQLLARTGDGRLCGRYQQDAFGRIVTQPESGWRGWLGRQTALIKLSLSSALAFFFLNPSRASTNDNTPQKPAPTASTAPVTAADKTEKQPAAQNSKPTQITESSEEPITLFMGIVCAKPKPPLRLKHRK